MNDLRALQACLHARLHASGHLAVSGAVVDVGNVLTLSWAHAGTGGVMLALWEPIEAALFVTPPGTAREVCLGTWSGASKLVHDTVSQVDGLADDLWACLRAQDAEPDASGSRHQWHPGVLVYAEWVMPVEDDPDPEDVLESKED